MQLSGFTGPIPRSSHSLLLGYRAFPQVNFEVLITIQADAAAGIGGHREASVGIRRIGLGLGITWPRKRKYEIPIRWPRPQVESGVARRANRSAVGSGSGRPRHRLDEAFSPLVPSHFHLACGLTLYSSAGRAAWLDSHKALHSRSRAYWRSEHPCNQPSFSWLWPRVPVVILYLCRRLVGRGVRGGDWAGFGPQQSRDRRQVDEEARIEGRTNQSRRWAREGRSRSRRGWRGSARQVKQTTPRQGQWE
jgi:hypothetical protein